MAPTTDENPEGVIFVLRNINNSINIDNQNRIHPLCEKFNKETDDGYNMGGYHSFCLMPEIRGAGRAQEAVAKADSNTAGEGTPGEAAE